MNPYHVHNFVIAEIENHQTFIDRYHKCLAEYRALSAFKRFFTKNPENDYWYFTVTLALEELKYIRKETEYKIKMRHEVTTIPDYWVPRFYKWAQDNITFAD
jgi:hypothetical protein